MMVMTSGVVVVIAVRLSFAKCLGERLNELEAPLTMLLAPVHPTLAVSDRDRATAARPGCRQERRGHGPLHGVVMRRTPPRSVSARVEKEHRYEMRQNCRKRCARAQHQPPPPR